MMQPSIFDRCLETICSNRSPLSSWKLIRRLVAWSVDGLEICIVDLVANLPFCAKWLVSILLRIYTMLSVATIFYYFFFFSFFFGIFCLRETITRVPHVHFLMHFLFLKNIKNKWKG